MACSLRPCGTAGNTVGTSAGGVAPIRGAAPSPALAEALPPLRIDGSYHDNFAGPRGSPRPLLYAARRACCDGISFSSVARSLPQRPHRRTLRVAVRGVHFVMTAAARSPSRARRAFAEPGSTRAARLTLGRCLHRVRSSAKPLRNIAASVQPGCACLFRLMPPWVG